MNREKQRIAITKTYGITKVVPNENTAGGLRKIADAESAPSGRISKQLSPRATQRPCVTVEDCPEEGCEHRAHIMPLYNQNSDTILKEPR